MQPHQWGEDGPFGHLMASQLRALRRAVEDQFLLDEDDFELGTVDGKWAGWPGSQVPAVYYIPEQFIFRLSRGVEHDNQYRPVVGGHAVQYAPGEQDHYEEHFGLDWQDVRRHFTSWIRYIARELDLDWEPDEDDEEEPTEFDEPAADYQAPEPIPVNPVAVAPLIPEAPPAPEPVPEPEPEPAAPVPTTAPVPTPTQPSTLQRVSAWAKHQKQEHGILWTVVAFAVTVVVAIVTAVL